MHETGADSVLEGPLEEHRKLIADAIDSAVKKARETPVRVMVFGPGKGGGRKYKKRCQIKEHLNKLDGVLAFFPEDGDVAGPIVAGLQLDPTDPVVLEDALAAVVHCIVVLEMSPGAVNEVAHYARRPSIAPKIFDLIPAKYADKEDRSYPGILRRKLDKRYFSNEEFETCLIAREICPHHVRGVQFATLLEGA